MMRVASVCSGIEAAAVAWHPLGWTLSFSSDIDPFANAVRAHHYPDVPNLGDMTKFKDWPDATIDLLVGGTPCQAFSVAGLRRGLADPRGNLTLTYLAVAAKYRPEWLVWENVPGVLSDREAFGAFLGGLSELGYGWAYRVLDAQYFGLAQRRKRVFVVASARSWQRAAAVLFQPASLSGHPAPRREAREGFAAATAPSLTASGRGVERTGESRGQDPVVAIARCVTTGEGTRQDYETTTLVAHALRTEGFDASEDGTGRGTPLVPVAFHPTQEPINSVNVCHALNANATATAAVAFDETQITSATNRSNPKAGDPCHTLAKGARAPAIAFSDKDHGADATEELAPTMRAMPHDGSHANGGGQMAVMKAMQVRRLTPRECERLMGFPDDYTLIPYRGKPAADGPRYKALGNSMAVPVMAWIGRRIQIVHEATERCRTEVTA